MMSMDDTPTQTPVESQPPAPASALGGPGPVSAPVPAEAVAVAAPVAKPSPKPKAADRTAPKQAHIQATGRRKQAIARVRMAPGNGTMLVNGQPFDRYFPREALRVAACQPLVVTHQIGKQNVTARVEGGGLTGQAGAIRLGIARALLVLDPALKSPLRAAGLLTRDPRERERKKYGQKGARKRFQWTKR